MSRPAQYPTTACSIYEGEPVATMRPAVGNPSPARCRMTLPTPCAIPAPCGMPCELHLGPERHAVLELGSLARLAVTAVPGRRGSFLQQAEDLFAQLLCLVSRQATPLTATTMMIFLRDGADEEECRRIKGLVNGTISPHGKTTL